MAPAPEPASPRSDAAPTAPSPLSPAAPGAAPALAPLATLTQILAQVGYAALILLGLYQIFLAPQVHYRHAIRLKAPVDPASQVTLRAPDARLIQQDRALSLVARPGAAPPAEAPLRVVVRNSLSTADIYHRLRELPRAEKISLEVVLPATLREVAVQPGWILEVDTSSDYARLVLRRLAVIGPLLLLPLLLARLLRHLRRRAAAR